MRWERKGLSPALTRVMEAATEKGGEEEEEEVLTEEVRLETDRRENGVKIDGRLAGTKKEDKTATKAVKENRVKRGREIETGEAKKGPTETTGGGASVRLSRRTARDQNARAVQSKINRRGKNRRS